MRLIHRLLTRGLLFIEKRALHDARADQREAAAKADQLRRTINRRQRSLNAKPTAPRHPDFCAGPRLGVVLQGITITRRAA